MRNIPTALFLTTLLGCAATNPADSYNRAMESLREASRRVAVGDLDGAAASYRAGLKGLDEYDVGLTSGTWERRRDAEKRAADQRLRALVHLNLVEQARKEANPGGPASLELRVVGWVQDPTPKQRMETLQSLLTGKPEGHLGLAIRSLEALANEGYAEAQFVLGLLNAIGTGVPKNELRAHALHLQAAKQGHSGAAYAVGNAYFLGRRGVPKDEVEAVKWWKKAAEAGQVRAQVALAEACLAGLTGPGQEKEAAAWIERAAKSGDADAVRLRDEWRASGRIR